MNFLFVSALFGLFAVATVQARVVVVTGATGRSGVQVFQALKALSSRGIEVRALVRNATKAKSLLGCTACDESEGIFLGDATKGATMSRVMSGADALVITTASESDCKFGFLDCKYQDGEAPKDISFDSVKTQVSAFAESAGPEVTQRHVVLMSTMDTTKPDNFLDRLGNGHVTFYSLNGEAFLMSSGLPFTIVKACGLNDGEGGKHKLITGHDDEGFNMALNHAITRADVARVMVAAVAAPEKSAGLRFDLCSTMFGQPQSDAAAILEDAMYPWDPRKPSSQQNLVV